MFPSFVKIMKNSKLLVIFNPEILPGLHDWSESHLHVYKFDK